MAKPVKKLVKPAAKKTVKAAAKSSTAITSGSELTLEAVTEFLEEKFGERLGGVLSKLLETFEGVEVSGGKIVDDTGDISEEGLEELLSGDDESEGEGEGGEDGKPDFSSMTRKQLVTYINDEGYNAEGSEDEDWFVNDDDYDDKDDLVEALSAAYDAYHGEGAEEGGEPEETTYTVDQVEDLGKKALVELIEAEELKVTAAKYPNVGDLRKAIIKALDKAGKLAAAEEEGEGDDLGDLGEELFPEKEEKPAKAGKASSKTPNVAGVLVSLTKVDPKVMATVKKSTWSDSEDAAAASWINKSFGLDLEEDGCLDVAIRAHALFTVLSKQKTTAMLPVIEALELKAPRKNPDASKYRAAAAKTLVAYAIEAYLAE